MSFGFFPPELVANMSAEFLPLSLFPRLCWKQGCPPAPPALTPAALWVGRHLGVCQLRRPCGRAAPLRTSAGAPVHTVQ